MTATLPGAGIFIEMEERRDSAGPACGAAIFGPVSAARSNRYRKIGWLAKRSGVDAYDEGRLMRYVKRL